MYWARGNCTCEAQQPRSIHAEVDVLQAHERGDDEAGANQQHEGQRDLHDDEPLQLEQPRSTAARSRSRFVQRPNEIRPRDLQRRNQPEDEARYDTHAEAEQKHAGIDADRVEPREPCRGQRDERPKGNPGDERADDAGRQRQQQALDHQFPDDACTALAEGRANGQLPLAADRAGRSRAARFAQEIRSTSPTAVCNRTSGCRMPPKNASSSGCSVRVHPLPRFRELPRTPASLAALPPTPVPARLRP